MIENAMYVKGGIMELLVSVVVLGYQTLMVISGSNDYLGGGV